MKTHTIKTPKAELLVVELPRVCDYYLYEDMIYVFDNENDKNYRFKGSYTLLGKPDEISEEDAAQLIPMYFDHERTASEYLIEMIESEIYWDVNPFGEEPRSYSEVMDGVSNYEIYEDVKDWHEAEQKTFNRNRSIIFKKNK